MVNSLRTSVRRREREDQDAGIEKARKYWNSSFDYRNHKWTGVGVCCRLRGKAEFFAIIWYDQTQEKHCSDVEETYSGECKFDCSWNDLPWISGFANGHPNEFNSGVRKYCGCERGPSCDEATGSSV